MSNVILTAGMDKLGRVVIPKPVRDEFDLTHTDNFSVTVMPETDQIILTPIETKCCICKSNPVDVNLYGKGKGVCRECGVYVAGELGYCMPRKSMLQETITVDFGSVAR